MNKKIIFLIALFFTFFSNIYADWGSFNVDPTSADSYLNFKTDGTQHGITGSAGLFIKTSYIYPDDPNYTSYYCIRESDSGYNSMAAFIISCFAEGISFTVYWSSVSGDYKKIVRVGYNRL